ncbi:hypothetical protein GQR58_018489 [Nymphon striatum]|nr:hypothetical protein GQR58_018489 [Nymphon striatum]
MLAKSVPIPPDILSTMFYESSSPSKLTKMDSLNYSLTLFMKTVMSIADYYNGLMSTKALDSIPQLVEITKSLQLVSTHNTNLITQTVTSLNDMISGCKVEDPISRASSSTITTTTRVVNRLSATAKKYGHEGLTKLKQQLIGFKSTDRHLGISKYMRNSHPAIKHEFDLWHIVKGLKKKLSKSKEKHLQPWVNSIANHLWLKQQPIGFKSTAPRNIKIHEKFIKHEFDLWHIAKGFKKKLSKSKEKHLQPWVNSIANHLCIEAIQTTRGGIKLCHEGHMYTKKLQRQAKVWWACVRRSDGCKGSLSTDLARENPRPGQAHDHPHDNDGIEVTKERDVMKRRARDTRDKPSQIVTETTADFEWFLSHNPFEVGPELISLESGLVDDKRIVTCDCGEEIGADIQYSNVKINHEDVMKSFILNKVELTVESNSTRIIDGSALLWCCDWKKDEPFNAIFEKYTSFPKYIKANIIVFDGYSISTKDATHQKCSGTASHTVEIHDQHPCPSERKVFLSNYLNKEKFVIALASKLKSCGFEVVLCPSDADTTIVKVALNLSTPATVYSDDTDVLCLLVHHTKMNPNTADIFLTNMTTSKNSQRHCYRIQDIINELDDVVLTYLLFSHAFTGCDTTSVIHMFEKISISNKLKSLVFRTTASRLYYEDLSPEEVGSASIQLFELMHFSTHHLKQIRKHKYEELILSNRTHIDPAILPPSPRAAYFHGLRVYHQIRVWRKLSDSDLEPLRCSWQMKDDMFAPVMSDMAVGPEDVLKIIRCSCK